MFTTDSKLKALATRHIVWSPTASEMAQLIKKYKDIPTKAIVEYVRDGASFRIYIVAEGIYISFSLVGVVAPRMGNSSGTGENATTTPGELYCLQSRHFTELRMLNREVDVIMDSLDTKSGVIFGTLLHPVKGNISIELLKNGLGRISERTLSTLKKDLVLQILQAEQDGRLNRRFIWESYEEPKQLTLKGPKTIEGICVEIISGDTIVIQPLSTNTEDTTTSTTTSNTEELKIILSSIRAPKLSQPRGKGIATASEPWAIESKEFVRSKLIGKRIVVHVDYERSNTTGTTTTNDENTEPIVADTTNAANTDSKSSSLRVYGTVHLAEKRNTRSLAYLLVSEGLAVCTRHRRDEPRSAEYDALQIAEAEAALKKKGQHSTENPSLTLTYNKLIDLSIDSKRAKDMFHLLPKGNERILKATVEYVFSG